MQTRPIAAAFFVVFCLVLCGLILHHQIAAHPFAAVSDRQGGMEGPFGGNGPLRRDRHPDGDGRFERVKHLDRRRLDFWRDRQDWQPASPEITQEAQQTVNRQLTALRDGDPVQAFSYQSQELTQVIPTPAMLARRINSQSPEFGNSSQLRYWQIMTDKSQRQARAFVMVEGKAGGYARGIYLLTLENGQFKVSDIETQREQR